MGRYDDIDSPDYNDTNMGIGAYYDSPEEKQIARLEKKLVALTAERDRLAAENAELRNGILPSEVHAHSHYQHVKRQRDAANATLDRLREVVPEDYLDFDEMHPGRDFDDLESTIRAILYPKGTDNAN